MIQQQEEGTSFLIPALRNSVQEMNYLQPWPKHCLTVRVYTVLVMSHDGGVKFINIVNAKARQSDKQLY
jgi:hypothetical protein